MEFQIESWDRNIWNFSTELLQHHPNRYGHIQRSWSLPDEEDEQNHFNEKLCQDNPSYKNHKEFQKFVRFTITPNWSKITNPLPDLNNCTIMLHFDGNIQFQLGWICSFELAQLQLINCWVRIIIQMKINPRDGILKVSPIHDNSQLIQHNQSESWFKQWHDHTALWWEFSVHSSCSSHNW